MTDIELLEAYEQGTRMAALKRLTGLCRTSIHIRMDRARRHRREAARAHDPTPSRDELEWAVTHYGLRGAADHYNVSSVELHQWIRRRGACGSTI